MELIGAKEIQRVLDRMEKKEVAKICRQTTRDVNKSDMLPAYQRNAASMVGGEMGALIAKNLTVRAMTKLGRNAYGAQAILKEIDAFVHIDKNNKRHYIPAAIEYGHAFPGRGGGKNAPKDVPANPFASSAFEANKDRTYRRTRQQIWERMQAFIRQNEVRSK